MPETPKTLMEVVTELGHSERHVTVDTPNPTIYATLYWGNRKGEGTCSEAFTMPWNPEKQAWENAEVGCRILFKGGMECDRLPENGYTYGLYCSPNEADVKLWMSAYVSALAMVMPPTAPAEEKQWMYGVAVVQTGRKVYLGNATSLRKEGDKYVDPTGKCLFTAKGYGIDTFTDESKEARGCFFSSFVLTEALHFRLGVKRAIWCNSGLELAKET